MCLWSPLAQKEKTPLPPTPTSAHPKHCFTANTLAFGLSLGQTAWYFAMRVSISLYCTLKTIKERSWNAACSLKGGWRGEIAHSNGLWITAGWGSAKHRGWLSHGRAALPPSFPWIWNFREEQITSGQWCPIMFWLYLQFPKWKWPKQHLQFGSECREQLLGRAGAGCCVLTGLVPFDLSSPSEKMQKEKPTPKQQQQNPSGGKFQCAFFLADGRSGRTLLRGWVLSEDSLMELWFLLMVSVSHAPY